MSIYEQITALVEKIRELSRSTGDDIINDINILKGELLALIPEMDDIRTRVNDDLETDQNRIVELENDVKERDLTIKELHENNAKLVSKMGTITLANIDNFKVDEAKETKDLSTLVDEMVKKFD